MWVAESQKRKEDTNNQLAVEWSGVVWKPKKMKQEMVKSLESVPGEKQKMVENGQVRPPLSH